MDFIYHGEANIYQEDLDGFLALAEDLQLKGLAGSNEERIDDINIQENQISTHEKQFNKKDEIKLKLNNLSVIEDIFEEANVNNQSVVPFNASKIIFDPNNEELKNKISAMVQFVDDREYKYMCTVCGTRGKTKQAASRHVESHLEGAAHPCNLCEKVSKSSNALTMHVSTYHRK